MIGDASPPVPFVSVDAKANAGFAGMLTKLASGTADELVAAPAGADAVGAVGDDRLHPDRAAEAARPERNRRRVSTPV